MWVEIYRGLTVCFLDKYCRMHTRSNTLGLTFIAFWNLKKSYHFIVAYVSSD